MVRSKPSESLQEADRLIDLEQYEDAEGLLKSALADHPKNADLMTKLGKTMAAQHKERQAEATFRDVLQHNPTHERAVILLGRLLDNSLRVNDAERLYRKTLKLAPDSHSVMADLVRLMYEEAKAGEALDLAKKHLERFPSEPGAYDPLSHLLLRMEEQLENHLIESGFARTIFLELMKNLVAQYDTLSALESLLDSQDAPDESLSVEVHEDILRVVGEMESVMDQVKDRKMKVPPKIADRIGEVISTHEEKRIS